MEKETEWARYYRLAEESATKEVERLARKAIRDNPGVSKFMMAMGTYFFMDNEGEIITDNREGEICPELDNLIAEWDQYLKLTGEPMTFTADGPKITDW